MIERLILQTLPFAALHIDHIRVPAGVSDHSRRWNLTSLPHGDADSGWNYPSAITPIPSFFASTLRLAPADAANKSSQPTSPVYTIS